MDKNERKSLMWKLYVSGFHTYLRAKARKKQIEKMGIMYQRSMK